MVRDDVPATDLLMSLAGVTYAAGTPDRRAPAERLLDLLMDGVTRTGAR